jgi:tetratricopeptide (TPR) repeat protein
MENKNALQLGIAAFKAGDKVQARFCLLKAVRDDPNNEQAWGWLSNTAETKNERIECLHRVLRINPKNSAAEKVLKELETNDWVTMAPTNTTQNAVSPVDQPLTANSLRQVINSDPLYRRNTMYALASSIGSIGSILLILGILIICCIFALAIYGSGAH